MGSISHVTDGRYGPIGGLERSKAGEPLDEELSALTGLLGTCALGVALFDRSLRCRALNGVLGAAIGGSSKKHVGKPLGELFPGAGPQFDVALRRAWTTGTSLSNLEVTASLPSQAGAPRRWLVNFYPISDEWGEVQLVAATFSEITKERCVEMKICRLRDKFRSDARRQPELLEGEFSEMSARTFDVVSRSLALLKSSVLLRFYSSHKRLGARLVQHALFLKADADHGPIPTVEAPTVETEPDCAAAQVSPAKDDAAECSPSPREREVLQFLADGKSSKEIGFILEISTRTVEAYRARIMLKLDLHSTAALVRYAIRNKIVEA